MPPDILPLTITQLLDPPCSTDDPQALPWAPAAAAIIHRAQLQHTVPPQLTPPTDFVIDDQTSTDRARIAPRTNVPCFLHSRKHGMWIVTRGRRLNIQESLRLQGFHPNHITLSSHPHDIMPLLGNTMSHNVIQRIALAVPHAIGRHSTTVDPWSTGTAQSALVQNAQTTRAPTPRLFQPSHGRAHQDPYARVTPSHATPTQDGTPSHQPQSHNNGDQRYASRAPPIASIPQSLMPPVDPTHRRNAKRGDPHPLTQPPTQPLSDKRQRTLSFLPSQPTQHHTALPTPTPHTSSSSTAPVISSTCHDSQSQTDPGPQPPKRHQKQCAATTARIAARDARQLAISARVDAERANVAAGLQLCQRLRGTAPASNQLAASPPPSATCITSIPRPVPTRHGHLPYPPTQPITPSPTPPTPRHVDPPRPPPLPPDTP